MFQPKNRLAEFFPVEPPESPPDTSLPKLLQDAHGIKLELLRYQDSDGIVDEVISYEVHGTIDVDDGTLQALLANFRRPAQEGGVA